MVNCNVCVVDGYDITGPNDKDACPTGMVYQEFGARTECCPGGTHMKPDGMCCVTNDADPCTCLEGWYQVAPMTCCPNGKFLSTDNPGCCTATQGATCCQPWQEFLYTNEQGICVPKKATGIVVR